MTFKNFETLHTQGPPPVKASASSGVRMAPVVVRGTQQVQQTYPGDHFAAMQAGMAAADPWKAGSDVLITKDAGGNPVFRDRAGRFLR